jgi:hypothetical protein
VLSWLSGVAGVLVLDFELVFVSVLLVDFELLLAPSVFPFGIESFLVRLSFDFSTMVSAGDLTVSIDLAVVSGVAVVSIGAVVVAVESAFGSSVFLPHETIPTARRHAATIKARDFINQIPSDVSI